MGIMKKGLRIGILLLGVLAGAAELRGQEVQWQAISAVPVVQTPTAALDKPTTLSPAVGQALQPDLRSPSPAPAGLMPVSFETVAPAAAPRRPLPIIAVSAPVSAAPPPLAVPPTEEQEDQSETIFASDHPYSAAAGASGGGIVRTSASVAVPAVPSAAEVPMVPGWEAPVDASWGNGLPTGPLPEYGDAPTMPPLNQQGPRFYFSGEYLLWWFQGQSVPVLATTSLPNDFGILGAPSTQVLYGGNQINRGPFSGGLFTIGYWLGCDQKMAVEFTGFFLGPSTGVFTTNSSMNPLIARPFLEANNGKESSQLTALPGVSTGTLTINAPSSLWGLSPNLLCTLCCGCNYRIAVLGGFRNINLDESLTITENVQGLPTAPPPFTNQTITVMDRFATQNHFYGGNVGLDAFWFWGRWSIEGRAQVALGDTVQILDINGSQHFVPGVQTATGVQQNFTGGLLALPSNIGHFTNNAFSVVPWLGFNLGYQILPNLRGFVGYNFLYWSNVIRPGTSIDRVLDVTQIPNFPINPEPAPVAGLHPAPTFHEAGFWAQGLSFGLQFMY
jgi:hypothetical protein